MTGQRERVFPLLDANKDVYIAYLPLAHILELCCGENRNDLFFLFNDESISLEMLMYFMGIKMGYSSPQTLTDQSTAVKTGEKGDLRVLRPSVMTCVPVSEECRKILSLSSSFSDNSRSNL